MIDNSKFQDGKKTFSITKTNKILLVLTGALLTGAAWRIRGHGGWGSMWGMFTVGLILSLIIFSTFGEWKKVTPEFLGVSAFLMAITVGGWGTINGQITGVFTTDGNAISINPWSGVFWVFAIGFGWAPFFGFMISRLFSTKNYTIKALIIMIFSFIIGELIGDLWLAHIVIPKISPDTYNLFSSQLADTTPWQEYLTHFRNASYFADDLGVAARNYESMVANFSSCTGAIAMWIVLKFVLKDKKGANIMILTCWIIGISITIADLWIFWGRGGLNQTSIIPPTLVAQESWSLWEYFTGFFVGGGIVWLLISQKPKDIQSLIAADDELIPKKLKKPLSIIITYGLLCMGTLVRPIASLMERRFTDLPILSIIVYIIGLSISLTLLLLNKMQKLKLPDWSFSKYSIVILSIYLIITVIAQQLLGYALPRESLRITDYLVILSVLIGIPLIWKINSSEKRIKQIEETTKQQ